jgi:hypothetical protein
MHWLYKFGTYEFPRAGTNPEDFQTTTKTPNVALYNGAVDLYGSDRTGIDDNQISTNMVIDTLSGLRALRRLLGTKADLYREKDSGGQEYTSARFTQLDLVKVSRYCDAVEVTLTFNLYRPIWYHTSTNMESRSISVATTSFTLDNTASEIGTGGEIILEADTGCTFVNPKFTIGSDWIQYNGTLTPSDVLVINNDGKTITLNNVDSFIYLTASNLNKWLVIAPGVINDVTLTCEIVGGTTDLDWEWETAVL